MRNVIIALTALFAFVLPASAQHVRDPAHTKAVLEMTAELRSKVWYDKGYAKPVPTTLKGALAAAQALLGADNAGYKMQGSKEVCDALGRVKLPCDYNTRSTLTMFLAYYGKGMFPAAGGTNPYCTVADRERDVRDGLDLTPDDCFIGRPVQNRTLADAVRRNAKLFKNGDLTAEAVKSWK